MREEISVDVGHGIIHSIVGGFVDADPARGLEDGVGKGSIYYEVIVNDGACRESGVGSEMFFNGFGHQR
jgi:hypothetical protein